ncbi:hypothetical protein ACFV1C_00355 [Streptomyces sp. NPDC059605]|uniref:hypothetical protein n=1 Tax=Streptomyces sp. NPDC059605 TaxID=3346882 RepID=UPI0036A0D3CA
MTPKVPAREIAGRAPTHRTHPLEDPVKYHCNTCDATFEAPTDTDTVRCLGCGETASKATATTEETR